MAYACLDQKVDDVFNVPGSFLFGNIAVFDLLPDDSWNLPKHFLHQGQVFLFGVFGKIITVHRFRVQRSGLRTKKALKIRSPHYKCSFSQVIANLASIVGSGLTKLTLLS
jgi:hypothetical protein